MGLLGDNPGRLSHEDAAIGQALVDVATISILQERIIRESALVNEQLQRALNSRVLIEQAKGVIAYTSRLDMDEAFQRLRSYARSNNKSLQETAARVIDGTLRLQTAVADSSRRPQCQCTACGAIGAARKIKSCRGLFKDGLWP